MRLDVGRILGNMPNIDFQVVEGCSKLHQGSPVDGTQLITMYLFGLYVRPVLTYLWGTVSHVLLLLLIQKSKYLVVWCNNCNTYHKSPFTLVGYSPPVGHPLHWGFDWMRKFHQKVCEQFRFHLPSRTRPSPYSRTYCWWFRNPPRKRPGMIIKPDVNNGISTTNLNWWTLDFFHEQY